MRVRMDARVTRMQETMVADGPKHRPVADKRCLSWMSTSVQEAGSIDVDNRQHHQGMATTNK